MFTTRRVVVYVAFVLGVIVGSLLQRPVDAQQSVVLFGTFNGAATAITTDASGNINAIAH